jgi:hypothetical protein
MKCAQLSIAGHYVQPLNPPKTLPPKGMIELDPVVRTRLYKLLWLPFPINMAGQSLIERNDQLVRNANEFAPQIEEFLSKMETSACLFFPWPVLVTIDYKCEAEGQAPE